MTKILHQLHQVYTNFTPPLVKVEVQSVLTFWFPGGLWVKERTTFSQREMG